MRRDICKLALKGLEMGVQQGKGKYVELNADGKVEQACYIGLAALASGIEAFVLSEMDSDDYPESYADMLENEIDRFANAAMGLAVEARTRLGCPVGGLDGCPIQYDRVGVIAHLNDNHEFSVEQINSCLELLGWC